ncbi:MAG: DUF1553 domain-containing protein [Planctomycetota bacterium]|nr:MAG: DUF1553 domain-containing protein [Planctomycetota bacterium]
MDLLRWRNAGLWIVGLMWGVIPGLVAAQTPPLHERIDAAVEAMQPGPLANRAEDADLVRRTYLLLVGRPPMLEELDAYLALPQPLRQQQTVEQLLDCDEFDAYFASVLDVWLMERRSGKRIPPDQWRQFLTHALQQGWSLDRLIRAVVSADGTGEDRAAARFLLDREVEPNALTRDIGRIFLGRDLQCAQCHDHPNIADYFQSEYYGIFAFVARSYLFEDPADNKKPYVGEKAEGEIEFKSVFFPEEGDHRAIPGLPGMFELTAEPNFLGQSAYLTAADSKHAGRPKFSRREVLGRYLVHPDNLQAARNWANRLWAHMFGQGLVHPVDFHHGDNPPKLPLLLETLAEELLASGWDVRHLLREIALSQAFARSIDLPPAPELTLDQIEDLQRVAQAELQRLDSLPRESAQQRRQQALYDACRNELQTIDAELTKLAAERQQLVDAAAAADKRAAESAQKQVQAAARVKELQGKLAEAEKAAPSDAQNAELTAQLKSLRQELESAEQAAQAAQQASQAAQQAQATAKGRVNAWEDSVEQLRWKRIAVADQVAEARGALRAALREVEQIAVQRTEIQQRLAILETCRVLAERRADLERATRELARARGQFDQVGQTLATLRAEVDAHTGNRAELAQRLATEQNALALLAKQYQAKQEAMSVLKQGLSQALAAANELGASELQAELAKSASQVAELDQRLTANRRELAEQEARVAELEEQIGAVSQALTAVQGELAQQEQAAQQLAETIETIVQDVDNREQALVGALQQWYGELTDRAGVRRLFPLSPEQLAGAAVVGLGLVDRFRAEAQAEWTKANQNKSEEVDPDQRQAELDRLYRKRVDAVTSVFVSMFAAPAGAPQDGFSATADQALFLANDGTVQGWLSPAAGSLTQRLNAIEDPAELARLLYRSLLSRMPTEQEVRNVETYLQARAADRAAAIRELVWGVFTSLEFRFHR